MKQVRARARARVRAHASEGTLDGFRSATERLIRIYSFVPRDVVYGAVRVARRRERKREGWRRREE